MYSFIFLFFIIGYRVVVVIVCLYRIAATFCKVLEYIIKKKRLDHIITIDNEFVYFFNNNEIGYNVFF